MNPTNDSGDEPLLLDFERRLKHQFPDCHITTDDRLLVYRELDDALDLTGMVGNELVDLRRQERPAHADGIVSSVRLRPS